MIARVLIHVVLRFRYSNISVLTVCAETDTMLVMNSSAALALYEGSIYLSRYPNSDTGEIKSAIREKNTEFFTWINSQRNVGELSTGI
jgi:hypothetical protein